MSGDDLNVQSLEDKYVTVEQFIVSVWKEFVLLEDAKTYDFDYQDSKQLLQFGRANGWLEEQDILWKDRLIERRNAARIVHEFLRLQCGELDEKSFGKAEKLTDIYDCKVCAKHVAQVYIKGIIPAKEEKRFQLLLNVKNSEMKEIVNRMFNRENRLKM